jgi:hypothetical protein
MMYGRHSQAGVFARKRDDAEVHGVLDHRFEDPRAFGSRNAHRDAWIGLLELGEHFGQHVQASALVGAHDDLAARDALHLRQSGDDVSTSIEDAFGILQEDFPSRSQRNTGARAVEELDANLFLDCADLGRDRRLGAETSLCSARKAVMSRDLDERIELIEIHWAGSSKDSNFGQAEGFRSKMSSIRRCPMRLVTSLLLLSSFSFGQTGQPEAAKPAEVPDQTKAAQAEQADQVTIPNGTKVLLVMKNSVSSRNTRPGNGVYLETSFPVVVDGRVAIPAGTFVQGVVHSVKRSGRVKGRAEVLLHFNTLIYPNGYTLSLAGSPQSTGGDDSNRIKDEEGTLQAEGTKGRDAATAAGTTVAGTAIGAGVGGARGAGIGAGAGAAAGLLTALFTRGEEVRLDPGTSLEMELHRPVPVDMARVEAATGVREIRVVTAPGTRKKTDRPVLTIPGQGPIVRD